MEENLYRIADTHSHYDDSRFDPDREELLSSLSSQGVELVVHAAGHMESSRWGIEYSRRYPFFYTAVGMHPQEAGNTVPGYLDELETLSKEKKVVALGEMGLDYHYQDSAPKEVQQAVFAEQLAFAKDLDLPVIVHDREAHADTLELLKKYRPKGIIHCYSGSAEFAGELIKLGFFIGFTGALTFSNARRAVEAVKAIPLDRLLLETDCPYMAPVPLRGKRSDSSMIVHTAKTMAAIKELPIQELLNRTWENAHTVYEINL